MKKPIEDYLQSRIKESGLWPRDIIQEMLDVGMINSPKQAWRTLEKWNNKRLYDYGVTLDLGWLL